MSQLDPGHPFVFNGVDVSTGTYDLPPLDLGSLVRYITQRSAPANLNELRFRSESRGMAHLGVKEGVDPKRLDQSGWGIVFAQDANPAIKEALSPLLQLRQSQAASRFRLYDSTGGYRTGEAKASFLARHGTGPGPADPDRVPYYLLICGNPAQIPYRFQRQLDVEYAVGRIHFQSLDDYANYAASVVSAETGQVRREAEAALFCVTNPDDPSTQLLRKRLMEPLHTGLQARGRGWRFTLSGPGGATKQRFAELLTRRDGPALVLASGHGMHFPRSDPRAQIEQGALLCDEWPGPSHWSRPIPPSFYFSAKDLGADADLSGLIAFFFNSYGGGIPEHDPLVAPEVTEEPFVPGLATRMLSLPRGGALAVAAPIGRALGYSSDWRRQSETQTAVFESTILRLIDGHPIGSAMEYLNDRYAELATALSDQLEEIAFGLNADEYDIVGLWANTHDSGHFAIVGDPAVRLATGQRLR